MRHKLILNIFYFLFLTAACPFVIRKRIRRSGEILFDSFGLPKFASSSASTDDVIETTKSTHVEKSLLERKELKNFSRDSVVKTRSSSKLKYVFVTSSSQTDSSTLTVSPSHFVFADTTVTSIVRPKNVTGLAFVVPAELPLFEEKTQEDNFSPTTKSTSVRTTEGATDFRSLFFKFGNFDDNNRFRNFINSTLTPPPISPSIRGGVPQKEDFTNEEPKPPSVRPSFPSAANIPILANAENVIFADVVPTPVSFPAAVGTLSQPQFVDAPYNAITSGGSNQYVTASTSYTVSQYQVPAPAYSLTAATQNVNGYGSAITNNPNSYSSCPPCSCPGFTSPNPAYPGVYPVIPSTNSPCDKNTAGYGSSSCGQSVDTSGFYFFGPPLPGR